MSADAVALVLAHGRGERLGAGTPKALVPLGGRPLVAWSLEALARAHSVRGTVLVAEPTLVSAALSSLSARARERVLAVVPGGPTRQESCARGLAAAPDDAEVIVVHDAARPFASPELFDAVVAQARAVGAALAAQPLADTLKRGAAGRVVETLAREQLWQAQTPQAVRHALLVEAHARAAADGVLATDDVALVERLGAAVAIVPSVAPNPKITTSADLAWAEAWRAAMSAQGAGA